MLGAGFLLVPESSYTMTDHPREGARTRPLVNGQLRQLTERPRMTVREVQTMLTAAMQASFASSRAWMALLRSLGAYVHRSPHPADR